MDDTSERVAGLLKEPGTTASKSVPINLRGHLQADLDEARERLAHLRGMAGDSLEDDPQVAELQAEIEDIRARMREGVVFFRLTALPDHKYRAMRDEHPPRKTTDEDGKQQIHPDDLHSGVNTDTFHPQLIKACTVSPKLTDEQWDELFAKLSTRDTTKLTVTALYLCTQDTVDNPFTPPLGSWSSPTSDAGSSKPGGSASASNASTGGNRAQRRATSTTSKAASKKR